MPMNIYSDIPANGPISFAVHLDTARTADNGAGVQVPDPDWVVWYDFPAADLSQKPGGMTDNQYRNAHAQRCKAEAKLLAREALRLRNRATRRATDLGTPETDNG